MYRLPRLTRGVTHHDSRHGAPGPRPAGSVPALRSTQYRADGGSPPRGPIRTQPRTRRRVKSDEPTGSCNAVGNAFVKQCAYRQRSRSPRPNHSRASRASVRPESTMSSTTRTWRPSSLSVRIIHQANRSARRRPRRHNSTQRGNRSATGDGWPDEVAQEDDAALEQPNHEQIAIGIGIRDLRAEFAHPSSDRSLVEDHALSARPPSRGSVGEAAERFTDLSLAQLPGPTGSTAQSPANGRPMSPLRMADTRAYERRG